MTVLITMVGAAGAVISWTSTEWIVSGHPSVLGERDTVHPLCVCLIWFWMLCRNAQWGPVRAGKHFGW